MKTINNFRDFLKSKIIEISEQVEEIYNKQSEDLSLLKFFMNKYELPEEMREKEFGKEFIIFNNLYISYINEWLSTNSELKELINDYKSRDIGIIKSLGFFKVYLKQKKLANKLSIYKSQSKEIIERFIIEKNKIETNTTLLENSNSQNSKMKLIIYSKPYCYRFLRVTEFLYSSKSQKEIFEPMASEWEFEYFEAIKENNFSKAKWINFRCAYSYIIAICLKNPISDLIEFIKKIAK